MLTKTCLLIFCKILNKLFIGHSFKLFNHVIFCYYLIGTYHFDITLWVNFILILPLLWCYLENLICFTWYISFPWYALYFILVLPCGYISFWCCPVGTFHFEVTLWVHLMLTLFWWYPWPFIVMLPCISSQNFIFMLPSIFHFNFFNICFNCRSWP